MHYRDLLITHRAFWKIERRAKHYDAYMKEAKDWEKWPDSVSSVEARKLLKFIPKWDFHFRVKDPEKFLKVYREIAPTIRELYRNRLEDSRLDGELAKKIGSIFDSVANCSEKAYESTDSSKILHTILPHSIVMWDESIREGSLGHKNKKYGSNYALKFLPRMQKELQEAISTCEEEEGLTREEAIKHICQTCGYETLPKLIDEHNFVIYTKTIEFRSFLENLKERHEITIEEYRRLLRKLPF